MIVPFTNTTVTNAERDLICRLVEEAATSGNFILKENAAQFERRLCEWTGAAHAVAVASGSDAIKLSLRAAGIGPGDEVLTPAFSFPATAAAAMQLGAVPRFLDVDPHSGCLGSQVPLERPSSRVRAVVAAHLFSRHADVQGLRPFADRHALTLIEDSAVSFGSTVQGRPTGRWGHVGVFSYFPVKPLGGAGEAGVIITDDESLAKQCRQLRNHGQDGITRFLHHVIGYNSRMDEIIAGFLLARLETFPAALARRAEIARQYDAAFARWSSDLELPPQKDGLSWYTYTIQFEGREALRTWLRQSGVETRVFYDPPLPLQPAFAALGHQPGDFPHAERVARRNLSLPLFPAMTDEQVEHVVNAVKAFFSAGARHVVWNTERLSAEGARV